MRGPSSAAGGELGGDLGSGVTCFLPALPTLGKKKREREIVIIFLHFGQVNWTLSATMEVLFQDEKFRRGKGRMASCSPGHANCLPGECYKGKNGPQGMEH